LRGVDERAFESPGFGWGFFVGGWSYWGLVNGKRDALTRYTQPLTGMA
jgi:hypothetical protein